jgi:hypothetical protein
MAMDDHPSLVAADASTQAVVENAQRLGLKWDLKPATVVAIGAEIQVLIDGDTTALTAISLIGGVYLTQRVFVVIIPPGGIFILVAVPFSSKLVLAAAQTSVNFVVPSNMTEVELGYCARSDINAAVAQIQIRINGNSGNLYTTENTQGNGAGTASSLVNSNAPSAFIGLITALTASAGIFGAGKVWFHNWNVTVPGPTFLNWTYNNEAIASGGFSNVGGGVVNLGPPYTSIQIIPQSGNFIAGSSFYVKGTIIL